MGRDPRTSVHSGSAERAGSVPRETRDPRGWRPAGWRTGTGAGVVRSVASPRGGGGLGGLGGEGGGEERRAPGQGGDVVADVVARGGREPGEWHHVLVGDVAEGEVDAAGAEAGDRGW